MKTPIILLALLLAFDSSSVIAQTKSNPKKTFYLDELIVKIATHDKQLPIKNSTLTLDSTYTIISTGKTTRQDSLVKVGGKADENGRVIIDIELNLNNIHATLSKDYFYSDYLPSEYAFHKVHFKKFVGLFNPKKGNSLWIDSCVFDDQFRLFTGNSLSLAQISNNNFNRSFIFQIKDTELGFNVSNNEFSLKAESFIPEFAAPNYSNKFSDSLMKINPKYMPMGGSGVIQCSGGDFWFIDNRFKKNEDSITHKLEFDILKNSSVTVSGNTGAVNLLFSTSLVEDRFEFTKNKINGYVNFDGLIFPESSVIDWDAVKNNIAVDYYNKLKVDYSKIPSKFIDPNSPKKDSIDISCFYVGDKTDDLLDAKTFNKLYYTYKRIRDTYIEHGDLRQSNQAYVAMKELEGRRLEAEYNKDGGLKNWLSLMLNRLMKTYTEHGTDPAKAIVISIWVVIAFGIFYFFFPSDWDVTSKSKLVESFKDFIEKNEKGYIKPFFTLLLGFVLSLINAFTLSLNSFTTLGFGNIPTHGLARYVCVIQGFIGWFLLSIFTVALINQVLA